MSHFVFRSLTDADLPMLHEWINRPHVGEWWDAPQSFEEIEADYGAQRNADSTTLPYIVELDGRPIGFIQSYVAMGSGDGWWEDVTDPGVRGIDQFIAEPDLIGRGVGTAMIRAFLEQLTSDVAVTLVQTDPDPANARAIRCYEKCGFERIAEIATPDGAALLMHYRRPLPPSAKAR
jgi:RimJ/RimL family protein N-acetyltransferase